MKKQNPTNKLAFNKVAVAELNENQLQDVNGGTYISFNITILITQTVME
ncbi:MULTISPECIES: class I lanthipeptide [Flavobacterium]|uniref:Class I lanthipeptide n=1 Tax=Flavobacterium cupriresistens TaxID=2893885 RepID=A0ABU4RHT0_9FLAO|nr:MULTISPECIES: class I lanthipeptide [unclassified Flavobacterium]MDX6192128.1 class I lanthipeptide [Flavobacterium sp. Fl-318]UFH43737.1 class I lanthipeptide [Flavobacterium sp. F-323]